MHSKYDSIVDLPHHVSAAHSQMPMLDRAAQFAPFAALSGYGAAVAETARRTEEKIELDESAKAEMNDALNALLRDLAVRPVVTITYFVPDQKKAGGAYVPLSGIVKKIDAHARMVVMESGDRIPIASIIKIHRSQEA